MIELKINDDILTKHEEFVFGSNKERSGRIYIKIINAYNNEYNRYARNLYVYIIKNLKRILLSEIEELFEIKNVYSYLLNSIPCNETRCKVFEVLKTMFLQEYRYFYNDEVFNAYQFQRMLDVNICPYCSTQFIFLYESSNGQTRGTLDHFIDKASYPIFAISIHNLIPCCKVCNSDFKKSSETNLVNYYSPYQSNVICYMKFRREVLKDRQEEIVSEMVRVLQVDNSSEIDYVAMLLGYNEDFNIKIDYSEAPENIARRIEGNLKMFNVEELYNLYHKSFVKESIKKAYIYNYVYRKQLEKNFSSIFNSEEELRLAILPMVENDNKFILNKLCRDIISKETHNFIF